MRIKKIQAATMTEALARVKQELGEEAVILKTERVCRGGLLDLVGQPRVEVTAAIDPETGPPLSFEAERSATKHRTPAAAPPSMPGTAPTPAPPPPALHSAHLDLLARQLKSVKAAVGELTEYLRQRELPPYPEPVLEVYLELIDNDVEEGLAKELLAEVMSKVRGAAVVDREDLKGLLAEGLHRRLLTSGPIEQGRGEPKVVALVGPTGVGKTTTIAKLAAGKKIYDNARVGLITVDTYRIAAVEQLRTFAEIADIPMEVVYSVNEMKSALHRFRYLELVFIDSAGRSPRNSEQIKELKKFVEAAEPQEIHLVLSATTRTKEQTDAVRRFSLVPVNRIIFTKLDETTSYGGLLNVLAKVKIPASYLTHGQSVPEDILVADKQTMANLILGEGPGRPGRLP